MNKIQLSSHRNTVLKKRILNSAVYILMAIVIVTYASLTPLFLSASNLKSLFVNSSSLLVAATGITFILLVAEIDLSIGSIAAISGALWVVAISRWEINPVLATLLALLAGLLLGGFNAFLVVVLKINSFLATLGMQIFLRGFVYILTGGAQILVPSPVKSVLTAPKFFGLPLLIILSIFLLLAMAAVYRWTSFGRKLQAVGCNRQAAGKIGIHVDGIRAAAFIICGLLAAIAGICQAANVGIIRPDNLGNGLEFLAITAAVLGGTSLLGGSGSFVPGTLVGVLFLMCIENGLGLLGANPYAYPIVRGAVIFLAMFSDSLKHSLSEV